MTLPLWDPSPVKLGAVGYLLKPAGSFVTLFNSYAPHKASDEEARKIPSLDGYGKFDVGMQRQDKRNAAQRGLDMIHGLLTFRNSERYAVVFFWICTSLTVRLVDPLADGTRFPFEPDTKRPISVLKQLSIDTWIASKCQRDGSLITLIASSRSMVLIILSREKTSTLVSRKMFHCIVTHSLSAVIGTLNSPDYALYVSHKHPDSQVRKLSYVST